MHNYKIHFIHLFASILKIQTYCYLQSFNLLGHRKLQCWYSLFTVHGLPTRPREVGDGVGRHQCFKFVVVHDGASRRKGGRQEQGIRQRETFSVVLMAERKQQQQLLQLQVWQQQQQQQRRCFTKLLLLLLLASSILSCACALT